VASRFQLLLYAGTEPCTKQQVSVERVVAAALAEQLSGWTRMEQMAGNASRERFLAALDKVPAAEPAPEDRLQVQFRDGNETSTFGGRPVKVRHRLPSSFVQR
jgi:hypothetical protein